MDAIRQRSSAIQNIKSLENQKASEPYRMQCHQLCEDIRKILKPLQDKAKQLTSEQVNEKKQAEAKIEVLQNLEYQACEIVVHCRNRLNTEAHLAEMNAKLESIKHEFQQWKDSNKS